MNAKLLVVLFLALPFVCLAFATPKWCSRIVRRILVALAYGILVFDGGCVCAAQGIGNATGGSSDDSWKVVIFVELLVIFIWSFFIFRAELRRGE